MRLVPSCKECNSTMEESYCSSCGGCGEGYTTDSHCSTCGGSGVTGEYYCYWCEEEEE